MISIILPAFNAENYIEECVESIIMQSYTDWELIIVDDGSTDKTAGICDAFAQRDQRIQVIHSENKGVSASRNIGLKIATGDYIAFVDADDILPMHSLRIRLNLIKSADLAIAGFETFNENGFIDKMPCCVRSQWNNHDAVLNILAAGEMGYQGYLWNKLFRNEILLNNNIRFDEDLIVNEDRLFCVRYALQCNIVRLSDETVYRYRISNTNTTLSVYGMTDKESAYFMTEFQAYDRSINLAGNRFPDCIYAGAVEAQYRARILKGGINKKEKILTGMLDKKIREYGKMALSSSHGSIPLCKKMAIILHMVILR